MATPAENVRKGIGVVGYGLAEMRNIINADVDFTYQMSEQMQNLIATAGNSNTEIVAARTDANGNTFTTIGERVDSEQIKVESQLSNKANKDEVFSMANMGQDVKEAMTGGSVAVVGVDAVARENVKNGAIDHYKTDFISSGTNLLNMISTESLVGKFYSVDGKIITQSGTNISHKIYVEPGDVIRFTHDSTFGPTSASLIFKGRLFTSTDKDVGNISDIATDFTFVNNKYCQFTVPNNLGISYIRINYTDGKKSTFMVVKDESYPSNYVPFNLKLRGSVEVDYGSIVNLPAAKDVTRRDFTDRSFIYDTTNLSDYIKSNLTHEVVDDIEGFRTPSRKVSKLTINPAVTAAYSLRKIITTQEQSANAGNVLFAVQVYTNSLQANETATFELTIQTSNVTQSGFENFARNIPFTLENGVPKVVYWEVPETVYKAFLYGTFGVRVRNTVSQIVLYTSFDYAGSDVKVDEIVQNPISYNDYTISVNSSVERKFADEEQHTFYKHLLINALCIGDSLTEGAYYDTAHNGSPIAENYPYYLGKLTDWNVTNGGKSGYSAQEWYNNKASTYDFSAYDTFVICLGTNEGLTDTLETDAVGDNYQDYADTNTGAYCKIIERIKEANPNAFIFITNIFASASYTQTTNTVLAKIAERYNLPLFDISSLANDPILHPFGNVVHFGKIGNLHFAKLIEKLVSDDIYNNPSKYEQLLMS